MADKYRPVAGVRIPMPGGQADWPAEGRAVNFSNPYESRLVAEGSLEKVEPEAAEKADSAKPRSTKGAK